MWDKLCANSTEKLLDQIKCYLHVTYVYLYFNVYKSYVPYVDCNRKQTEKKPKSEIDTMGSILVPL